jgi:hypothetical protein
MAFPLLAPIEQLRRECLPYADREAVPKADAVGEIGREDRDTSLGELHL